MLKILLYKIRKKFLLKSHKYLNYDLQNDLNYNKEILTKLNLKIDNIKNWLLLEKIRYDDVDLSWHYHLFSGLKDYFGEKKISILEIGTYDGKFTNFISNIYANSEIYTIDLKDSDLFFLKTYGRNNKKKLNEFLKIREENLNRENIIFKQINSIHLKRYFDKKKFDLIWLDGDHHNPQVTIDIINSLDLLNNHGVLCVDDIIKDNNFKTPYVSSDSYNTIKCLEQNNIIKSTYLIKRIRKSNFYKKKFISISTFYQNQNFLIIK